MFYLCSSGSPTEASKYPQASSQLGSGFYNSHYPTNSGIVNIFKGEIKQVDDVNDYDEFMTKN